MTQRETFLLRVLALVAGISVTVGGIFLGTSTISQIDRDIVTAKKQLEQLTKNGLVGSDSPNITEQIAELTARKQDIESHLFQKGELSIYDFAQQIRAAISDQGLTILLVSIDAKTNEIVANSAGNLQSILRFLRDLQSGNKYFKIQYLAIQRLSGSECSMQVRVAYAEIPF